MTKKEKLSLLAKEHLLNTIGIKPGDEIQCVLRSVSRSGMNRKISLIYNGENISYWVAELFQEKPTDKTLGGHWALNVSGCGMDMGFNCVYNLGRCLFPEGCESGRYGKPDTDGGYALKHRWL